MSPRYFQGARATATVLFWAFAAAAMSAQRATMPEAGSPERRVIRAVLLTGPLTVDGRLDERVYADIPPIGDFIQQEPHEGEPASEQTDVWLFYDDKNLYIAAQCWDSHPERIVANELRRDGQNIFQNDNFVAISNRA